MNVVVRGLIQQRKEHDMDLRERISEAINCTSAENGSNTPDFILAEYLTDCLAAFDKATTRRTRYFAPTEDGKPVPVSPNAERDVRT